MSDWIMGKDAGTNGTEDMIPLRKHFFDCRSCKQGLSRQIPVLGSLDNTTAAGAKFIFIKFIGMVI